jgi:hypothetical protein
LQRLKTYQRGINDGLRSWLKCQAIRNQESFSSSTECFLYTLADKGKYRSNKAATPAGVVFVFIEPWPARLAACLNRAQ